MDKVGFLQAVKTPAKNTDLYVVTPGEVILTDAACMRGHGVLQDDKSFTATVAGAVVRVNKLVCIVPYRSRERYCAEVGDVIVGRIIELGPRCWRVSIGAHQDAVMLLSSINLPGGVQRRKLESDELQMRTFFSEGDLLSAEIHSFFQDGAAFLHVRNSKYGKLKSGTLLIVPPVLIKHFKSHFITLPCNVAVILGRNGWIWICKKSSAPDDEDAALCSDESEVLTSEEFDEITRVRNCIQILSEAAISINKNTICQCYDAVMDLSTSEIISDNTKEMLQGKIFISAQKTILENARYN